MKLYNFSWGPYPRRLTLYLAEKGITDIELVEVEFPHRPEKWPERFLLNLNPAHSLPVLDAGGNFLIGQSIAILEFLEERYPTPNMLGLTPQERALTRESVEIFDEAASFFGLWARQGSRINIGRHPQNTAAAVLGAERYANKMKVAEAKLVGPFITGANLTIADCVGMALVEFADQFYGVPLPQECPKLAAWYAELSKRDHMQPARYPADMLEQAYGLPDQTQTFI